MGFRHPSGEVRRSGHGPPLQDKSGVLHGTRMRSDGQGPDRREHRFPRQQHNQAPVPAEPAIPPFLGRGREPLGAPACLRRRLAPDRQEGHRRSAGGPAGPRPGCLRRYHMASKGGREKIKLESTAGTGHFYTTSKNKKTMPEKMSIMKFDPKARKHVEYKETKLK